MTQKKILIGFCALAGVIAILVIGYNMGKKANRPGGVPMIQDGQVQPNPGAGTGAGHRKQEKMSRQSGNGDQVAQNVQGQGRGRRSSDESIPGSGRGGGGRSRGRPVQIKTAEIPASLQITVVANEKTNSLSGAEIQKLKSFKVAAARGGIRDGWAVTDVLGLIGVQNAKRLVFTDSQGKTLEVPWEKLSGKTQKAALVYSNSGQLWLVSGREMSPNDDIQAVMQQVREDKEPLFFPGIVKIEVKN